MQVTIRGRNVEITPRLEEYVEKKVGKLDRYLPTISEARMELSAEKTKSAQDSQVVQLTIRSKGAILRVEERNQDLFTAIDSVMDKMYRQIGRYKGKHKDRARAGAEEAFASGEELLVEAEEEEAAGRIVRVKTFRMVSINPEEAIEQMELLGHDFYVFFNAEAGAINVLYRRKDGDYGLIQPEMA
jgi:putative sigma-54 modulation protein